MINSIEFTLTESFLLIRGRAFSGSRRNVISSCFKNEFMPGTSAWGLRDNQIQLLN